MQKGAEMADLSNPLNRTIPAEIEERCSRGIADCWHGVIEKTVVQQDGDKGHTTRINVEVKSVTNLISHYDQPAK